VKLLSRRLGRRNAASYFTHNCGNNVFEFGLIRRTSFKKRPLAAPAAKARFVRNADIGVECSESPLSAISNSGGVAVSYCSGYALEVMREHLEKTWT